jgi:histidine triad (HIT) family protein
MDNCIFCKIVKGEIASEKIFEDDTVLAFLDVMPKSPGHTMVVPKIHAEFFEDVPKDDVGHFFSVAQDMVTLIKKALTPDGFTLGMNHGKVSGQEVPHVHFHIMPRWIGDGGHSIQSVVSNKPAQDIKTIAEKIRQAK